MSKRSAAATYPLHDIRLHQLIAQVYLAPPRKREMQVSRDELMALLKEVQQWRANGSSQRETVT